MGFFSADQTFILTLPLRLRTALDDLRLEAPLFLPALALLTGAGGAVLGIDGGPLALTAMAAGIAGLAVRFSPGRTAFGAAAIALLLAGLLAGRVPAPPALSPDPEPRPHSFLTRGEARAAGNGWSVRAELAERPGHILIVRGPGAAPDWPAGTAVTASARLGVTPPVYNFGVTPLAPGSSLYLKTLRLAEVTRLPRRKPLQELRAALAAALDRLPLDQDLHQAARGMLLGERGAIPAPLRGLHQRLSTYHIFIVSGLQFALALLLARALCGLCALPPRATDLGLLAFLAAYFLLLSGDVAVRRAACFGALYLLARLSGRQRPALNGWALALILELVIAPATLFSLGFQLSYLATLALILQPRRTEKAMPGWGERLRFGCTAPFKVFLWLLPVQSALGPLPLLGPLANGWVFLFGELLLFPLWIGALLEFAGMQWVARPFAFAANLAWRGLNGGLRWLDAPDIRLSSAAWPVWLALGFWLGLALTQRLGWKRAQVGLAALALLFTLLRPAATKLPAGPVFEMLDVGQGDALLLSEDGGHFLLDAGPPGSSAALIAALRARGIFRLQGCALSHQDNDHSGGMARLLGSLHCELLYLPAGARRDPGLTFSLEIARARNIPVRALKRGDQISFKSGRLRVLWPLAGAAGLGGKVNSTNNRGLVLLWENRDFRALLTGDIEAAGEAALTRLGLPGAAILKVAHHGSKTSSTDEFLAAAAPLAALASVGDDNRYGHPHPLVLARLQSLRLPLLRTDQSGGLRVFRIGDALRIESARLPPRTIPLQPN